MLLLAFSLALAQDPAAFSERFRGVRTYMARQPIVEELCRAGDDVLAVARAAVSAEPARRDLYDATVQLAVCRMRACAAQGPTCALTAGPSGEVGATLAYFLARRGPMPDPFLKDPAGSAASELLRGWFYRVATPEDPSLVATVHPPVCTSRGGHPCAYRHAFRWGPDWLLFSWSAEAWVGDEVWHREDGGWYLVFARHGYQ